jgi:hypothetical protein
MEFFEKISTKWIKTSTEPKLKPEQRAPMYRKLDEPNRIFLGGLEDFIPDLQPLFGERSSGEAFQVGLKIECLFAVNKSDVSQQLFSPDFPAPNEDAGVREILHEACPCVRLLLIRSPVGFQIDNTQSIRLS